MKATGIGLLAVIAIASWAPPADAKLVALYAAGQGGVQQSGAENTPGLGFELGARVLILDGYLDYMNFGQNQAVARGIIGLRAGIGTSDLRLVLRAGVGGIREENGALAGDAAGPVTLGSRTGGVARAGIGVDARLDPLFYLGFMLDAETFLFAGPERVGVGSTMVPASYRQGADVFAALRLTFELGI